MAEALGYFVNNQVVRTEWKQMIPASRRSDLDLDSGSVYMEPNPMEISQNSFNSWIQKMEYAE